MLKLTHRMGFVMVPGNCYKLYIIAHLFTLRVREDLEGALGVIYLLYSAFILLFIHAVPSPIDKVIMNHQLH